MMLRFRPQTNSVRFIQTDNFRNLLGSLYLAKQVSMTLVWMSTDGSLYRRKRWKKSEHVNSITVRCLSSDSD